MSERHEQSPVVYGDIQQIISICNESLKETALLKLKLEKLEAKVQPKEIMDRIDMKQSKELSNRSDSTIRRLCPIRAIGVNGRHLFDKSDVIMIKK